MNGQRLTIRQQQVMTLVANGRTDRHIGQTLGIEPDTVRVHVNRSLKTLNARTRAHAVGICLITGEIDDAAIHIPEPGNTS